MRHELAWSTSRRHLTPERLLHLDLEQHDLEHESLSHLTMSFCYRHLCYCCSCSLMSWSLSLPPLHSHLLARVLCVCVLHFHFKTFTLTNWQRSNKVYKQWWSAPNSINHQLSVPEEIKFHSQCLYHFFLFEFPYTFGQQIYNVEGEYSAELFNIIRPYTTIYCIIPTKKLSDHL